VIGAACERRDVRTYLRTRGEVVDKDDARTNFTTGLHVGYTITSPSR